MKADGWASRRGENLQAEPGRQNQQQQTKYEAGQPLRDLSVRTDWPLAAWSQRACPGRRESTRLRSHGRPASTQMHDYDNGLSQPTSRIG
ncbi:hypothetical protein CMQ_2960 [Grosmannia clavigera kw1407]|uniref:Uncharacterized protein n=1 Tax=Grosmannia clavigera (strain kw1407 / UAMH 11150) TaxID=655863 RepID=F0XHN6_GROCL|nr:uncharacterized protein CMQ_2960 [Grosmannia clavigera kw1407]EFX03031.1 hypothetical protein CMQ_2960 [Grosmannia clavigera kw1407]